MELQKKCSVSGMKLFSCRYTESSTKLQASLYRSLSLSHTCFLTPCVFAEDVMEDGGFHHSLIGQSDTKWQPLISSETSELCDSVASSRTRHERKRAAGRRFRRFQKLPSTFQIKTFCRLNRVGFWIGLERGSWRRKKRRSSGAIMLTLHFISQMMQNMRCD